MQEQFTALLNDVDHNYGQDISLTPNNDIAHSTGSKRSKQRVLRRLLTNKGDYIWHPEYGAGLAKYIGQDLNPTLVDEIKSNILAQIFLEQTVSRNPEPEISLQTIIGGLFVQINYTESKTNNPIVLSFNVAQ